MDPIDNGTKVMLAFRRLTNPKSVAAEEARKKEEAAAKREEVAASKKAGSWGGLPGVPGR